VRRLRVLFIVPHPIEGPSSRFRVYQFLPTLAAHGIDAEVRPFLTSAEAPIIYGAGGTAAKVALTLKATLRRLGDVLRATCYDAVFVLREAFPFGPAFFETLLKAASGRLIFDFDDAIYVPSTAYRNPLDRLRDWGKTARIVARADHILAGSHYLADWAEAHAPGRVTVLPTVVDTEVFRPAPVPRPDGPFTVGWIGTPRGTSYLHPLIGAMRRLKERVPGIRLTLIGAEPFPCEGLPVSFPPWRLDTEVDDIRAFDVGLMPLADDEEAKGKCGFKLIEYMSLGVPVVCSPVGANRDIVEEGRSGFFATNEDAWVEAIARLAEDPALHARFAAEGRRVVEERYSLAAVAPVLAETLREVVEGLNRPSSARR